MIKQMTCPVCSRPLSTDLEEARRTMPFCSVRCRQVDLFRWAEGKYAVVEEVDAQEVEILRMDPDIEVCEETEKQSRNEQSRNKQSRSRSSHRTKP